MRRDNTPLLLVVAFLIVGGLLAASEYSRAQYVGGGSIAGGGGSAFGGGTLTTGLTFSAITTDISTPGSEDLTIAAGGKIHASGQTGLTVSDTSDFLYSDSAVGLQCSAGHRCIAVKGDGSRRGSLLVTSRSASAGALIAMNWNTATNDREVWHLEQETTAVALKNVDEDDNAVNHIAWRAWDTGGVQIHNITAATPAEPVACAAATTGTMAYVDDTDDTAPAAMCVCIDTDDGSTFDWVRVDDHSTACPFF